MAWEVMGKCLYCKDFDFEVFGAHINIFGSASTNCSLKSGHSHGCFHNCSYVCQLLWFNGYKWVWKVSVGWKDGGLYM